MRRLVLLLALFFSVVAISPAPAADADRTIHFTKKVPLVVPRTYTLRFTLWKVPIGGDLLSDLVWLEETTMLLKTKTVRHYLGSVTPFSDYAVDFSQQYWVEVERKKADGSYRVLGGRSKLNMVPYALHCPDSWGLQGNSGLTGSNYLGTNDQTTLDLRVGYMTGWRLVPEPGDIPNIIGGYPGNSVTSGAFASVIGGGGDYENANTITDRYCVVGGGTLNQAGDGSPNPEDAANATVGGGERNTASGSDSTVAGGSGNTASAYGASVLGGLSNTAGHTHATVAGGSNNTATGVMSFAGGGGYNDATGDYSFTAGGWDNTAAGNLSFAAGLHATANNDGCFVWGDSSEAAISCDADNRWMARATGGVYFFSNSSLSTGVYLAPGAETWQQVSASDRNLKENFSPVDRLDVLDKLAAIPITSWTYKGSEGGARHMSPMAQDFHGTFELGEDDRHLSALDTNGVALAAIQGLYELLKEKDRRIAGLEQRIMRLESLRGSR